MWLCQVFLLTALASSAHGNCKLKDAKWTGAPEVTAGARAGKIRVDWRNVLSNPECADSFDIWVWVEGQTKAQGKKVSLVGHQALTKEVTIEPCVFYNVGVDLHEKDLINSHKRESKVAKYNTASLPALNTTAVLDHLTVGYYKSPTTGQYDLGQAVVRVAGAFLSSFTSSCVKHIEVTGTQKAGARAARAGLAGSRGSGWAGPGSQEVQYRTGGWEPYGAGRQPGGRGRPAVRRWGALGAWHAAPTRHLPGAPVSLPARAPGGPGDSWAYPAPAPKTATPASGSPPPLAPTRSFFTNHYVKLVQAPSSTSTSPSKASPPFTSPQTEVKVPVEPCKEYEFSLRVVTPAGGTLATVPGLLLPALPDILDFVPPPFSQVVKVSSQGSSLKLEVQPSSPVPQACLPTYMEAVDAFAARLEAAANTAAGRTRAAEGVLGKEQDLVEMTQEKVLARLGCSCSSPRLEVEGRVFLYQGQSEGRPYYREDLEGRSLPAPAPVTRRSKRSAFIGRVDGGGTTTTRRPWNYGAQGGSVGRGGSSTGTLSGGARLPSRGGARGSVSIPIQRGPSSTGGRLTPSPPAAPLPSFLYWTTSSRQWLVSPRLAAPIAEATISSQPASSSLCPADIPTAGRQLWRTKQARTRSGQTSSWADSLEVAVTCAPNFAG